jgi:hypothetical protein
VTSPASNTPPLSGAGDAAPAAPAPTRRALVTLLAALPWVLLLFQFVAVIPRYERMYRENALKVPAYTQFLLDVAAWVNGRFLLAGLLTLALMAAGVWFSHTAQSPGTSRASQYLLLLTAFLVPCGLFVLTWVGVMGTHSRLVEGLNK